MKLPQYLLLFAFQLYNYGLAPSERNVTLEIFVDQVFRSEVCEAGIPPVWHIDGIPLIRKDIIQNIYRAQVERGYDNSTGNWQATLIMNQVYLFNGSVITCSANLTLILMYRLEVVNLTVKWLPMNESFTSAVCTSPFVDSPPPYWVINGDILSNLTIIKRYGAEIDRPTQDQNGRHQTILTISSVSAKLNGSNISCVVDSEIRRMYILYALPEENMHMATTDRAMTEDEPAKTTKDITEISSGNLRDIAVGVPVGLVLLLLVLAIALVAVICAVYLYLKKCRSANAELNTTVSELIHDDSAHSAHSATVAEGSQLSSESPNALVMPRRQYGLPASNMQRGVANGGIEGAPNVGNMRNQDVRPHHENERDIPDGGACQGQCIPEENQGEGHAAAKVFGKVSVQNFPNGPLKVYLTDKEILKEEMD